jgi:3-hydroxyisobutyrate dehydrogenase-like beta-hydroxyacid dehydrogenase
MRLLHAPVFMGPAMARESKGLMMVSGPAAVFEAVKTSLAGMAADLWYVGEREDLAASFKIFGNSMLFVMTAGLADVLAMGKNLGISPAEAISVFDRFNAGAAIAARAKKIASHDFSASFELTMARKDMRLMLEAAGPEPLTALPSIARRMDEAIAAGHGKDDLGARMGPAAGDRARAGRARRNPPGRHRSERAADRGHRYVVQRGAAVVPALQHRRQRTLRPAGSSVRRVPAGDRP